MPGKFVFLHLVRPAQYKAAKCQMQFDSNILPPMNWTHSKRIKNKLYIAMTTKKTAYLLITFILLTTKAIGQTDPPPMAMPADSSVILVDKIMEITKHEKYFVDYCSKKINNYSAENNWTSEKTKQILESIKFEYYNSTIYNSYAFYSIDQLKALLDALTLLNQDANSSLTMVLTNAMMQSNLDLFVEGVIEGKYVTKR